MLLCIIKSSGTTVWKNNCVLYVLEAMEYARNPHTIGSAMQSTKKNLSPL